MENEAKQIFTNKQYQRFNISLIYNPKIKTSYSPFPEYEHQNNRHRNQSSKIKKTIHQYENNNDRQAMMCQQAQDYNYEDCNSLTRQLSKISINQCEHTITNNSKQKQKVLYIIEVIRKSLCQEHIVINLNLIMSSGLYQLIISYSYKLACILINNDSQNSQNISILKECLWILTNLCTGTQQQVQVMIQVGLINLIDICLKLKSHKLIIVSTLELIGNLVEDQLQHIKLHFLQNLDFFHFYENRLEQYWYEDDGKFSQKIVWILANTFYKVPTLITDYEKWKQIVIKYLPIFISLLQISYRTTSCTTSNKLTKQYIQKNNIIQSQQYIHSKNTQILTFPFISNYKISKKTIKYCYFIFDTITCIDYPYLFVNLHQVVKAYDFQVVPQNCRNFVVRMYANIIGFHCAQGVNFIYQYQDLLQYIIHQIRDQQNKTNQQSPITLTCLQIITSILQQKQSAQKFIRQYFQQFEVQLSYWLIHYKNNKQVISAIVRLLVQFLRICIKEKFVGVIDRIFYYALAYVHDNISHIVVKVDAFQGVGIHHEDYNRFLSVLKNYLQFYVLYLQFIKAGTRDNSNSRVKNMYAKLSETMTQHKHLELILVKIYNIYNRELQKYTNIEKSTNQINNVQKVQNFISDLQSTSTMLNNNVQYIQKMLLDYQMTGLSV